MVKANKPFSADWEHVQACYRYVKSLPGVKVDTKHVMYAGALRECYRISMAQSTDCMVHVEEKHLASACGLVYGL
jgi:hypothetical protein